MGLIGALELVADKETKAGFTKPGVAAKVVAFAEEEGVILRAIFGETVAICPPLIISEQDIDEVGERLGRALDRTEEWVRQEQLRG